MAMDKGKKRLIIGGAVAGGSMLLAAGLVIGAGVAKADGYGSMGDRDGYAYATELHMHGMAGDAPGARSLALTVCEKRSVASESTLIDYATNMDYRMDRSMAIAVVVGAEFHFCPEYYSRTMSPGSSNVAAFVQTGHGRGGHK